eukprot:scaffold492_cov347-Prasinococcus_capsulatus_cf.AAC.2
MRRAGSPRRAGAAHAVRPPEPEAARARARASPGELVGQRRRRRRSCRSAHSVAGGGVTAAAAGWGGGRGAARTVAPVGGGSGRDLSVARSPPSRDPSCPSPSSRCPADSPGGAGIWPEAIARGQSADRDQEMIASPPDARAGAVQLLRGW